MAAGARDWWVKMWNVWLKWKADCSPTVWERYKKQWGMLGAACLWMEFGIWFPQCWEIQADTYPSCSTIREASDWPQIYSYNSLTDNNPKHTGNIIKNYPQCEEKLGVLEVMVWPHRVLMWTSWSLSGITWGDRRIWGKLHPKKMYLLSSSKTVQVFLK